MKDKNQCMDSSETKSDNIEDTKASITFKGWNIKDPLPLIQEEIEDYLEADIINLKILETQELAYFCSKYYEGSDANDYGYGYWIEYRDNWKKGYGKATMFVVEYEKKEMEEE